MSHEAEFEGYVELLCLEYRRERNFIKLLDAKVYLKHLRQVVEYPFDGLQPRIRIAQEDGARVVLSDPGTLLTEKEYLPSSAT